MNKKFALSILSVLAIFAGVTFTNFVSADTTFKDSVLKKTNNGISDVSSPQASTTIVISQVYGGGGGSTGTYKFDYVELFNLSGSPISLNGLALQYGSAAGQFGSSATNIFALPDATLQPGQHYLVQLGGTGTAGADFPVMPDATTTNLSISGSSGKVALTNTTTTLGCGATATPCTLPDARIIDEVSYGAANNAEGGASANNGTAITSTQGVVRNSNGCTDTDNNNNDFTVVTNPVPRNAASPLTPCGGTPTPTATPQRANVDFNGDNKSDWVVTRNVDSLKNWYISINSAGNNTYGAQWGINSDVETPADYDGDGKTDIAVWRSAPSNQAAFYIIQSASSTVRIELFGQTGDDPKIVADYDGDKKADVAVYRASPNGQGFFYYRGTLNNPNRNITFIQFGTGSSVRPNVGDYDGDGRADFCLYVTSSGSQGQFVLLRSSDFKVEYINWGLSSDALAPGDYDGDGKSDFCVVRNNGGQLTWYILNRSGTTSFINWGLSSDALTPGDYDGDGKQDVAVWRPNSGATSSVFYVRASSSVSLLYYSWGTATDYPAANWFVH